MVTRVEVPPRSRIQIPTEREAQKVVSRSLRAIADLPAPPKQSNAMVLVLYYTMFGMSDTSISHVTNLSVQQIENIRVRDEYRILSDELINNVRQHELNTVAGIISEHSERAARKLVEHVNADDPSVSIRAAADILDRAGHRPVDRVEHNIRQQDEFVIRVIDDTIDRVPTIDVVLDE